MKQKGNKHTKYTIAVDFTAEIQQFLHLSLPADRFTSEEDCTKHLILLLVASKMKFRLL